jgi:5-methylcytosine-specific restriction endonuclease McrA
MPKKGKKKKSLRSSIGVADFNHLMKKQKGLCANKECRSLHGKRQPVSITRDIDHKYSVRLWELKKKEGNPNTRANLQLLCPDCHRRKNAEDRKKITQYKREHPPVKKKPTKQKQKDPWDLSQYIPKI